MKKIIRLNPLFPRIKNKIKRIFSPKEQGRAQDITELDLEYNMSEEQVNEINVMLEQFYSIIKYKPVNERRQAIKDLSPEGTDEALIDFIFYYTKERERENLIVKEPLTEKERKQIEREQRKEDKNTYFPDKMIEDFSFDK